MKVKLFGKMNADKNKLDVLDLEDKMNSWMAENPNIRIIDIKQSSNGGSFSYTKLFFSIWYEETA